MQKSNIDKRGKSGFTLVELSVALALVAIVTTMMVSFSVAFKGFVNSNESEFAFYEDSDKLKQELGAWLAENDEPDCVFSTTSNISLNVEIGANGKAANFARGVLYMGDKRVEGLNAIDGATFEVSEKLIKCTTYRKRGIKGRAECSFVFYIRSGRITEVTEDE